MAYPQHFIDDLKLRANLQQVVQEYVPLTRAGTAYKGLCPFHAEKTPSFHVHPDKGFFHCFGCGVGGDVFKFLELHEKLAFPEAVRMLAQKFGLSLPEPVEQSDDARRDAKAREELLKVHDVAASYFRQELAKPSAERARRQLADRGLNAGTIEQLGLGFAPSSRDGLKRALRDQGFTLPVLMQSGLVLERDGAVVDRFRQRLMIPICREAGSIVAFGGRAMSPDQVPKYLNSPETPVYSKGRILYGLHLTKSSIRQTGFAVLVEGYFDFAQLFQTTAAPAVATCGTALTLPQAQLLRRFTAKVVLSYDPDPAGQGAAARASELLVSVGFDVNVAALEPGEDPDVFIRKRGAQPYRERLRASRPYLEYLLDRTATGLDLRRDEGRRQFLSRMLEVAAKIPDPAVRDQFADRMAHKARITEAVVRAEIRKAAAGRRTDVAQVDLPTMGTLKAAEKGLIWGIFHQTAEAVSAVRTLEPEDFEELAGREVFEVARTLQNEPIGCIPSELLRRLSTMNAQLVTAVADEESPPVNVATGWQACVRALKRLRCERERAVIQREIDRLQELGTEGRGDQINVLLNQKRILAQRIEELT